MSVDTSVGTGRRTLLREKRIAAGLSQERLAQLAGCSTSTVRHAEYGMVPSIEMLGRLAKALRCHVRDLEGLA